jgi:hypothetical protein
MDKMRWSRDKLEEDRAIGKNSPIKTWAETQQEMLASSFDAVLGVGWSPATTDCTTTVGAWQAPVVTISTRRAKLAHKVVSAVPSGSLRPTGANHFTNGLDGLREVIATLAAILGVTTPKW